LLRWMLVKAEHVPVEPVVGPLAGFLMFTPDGAVTTARQALEELETSGPLFVRPDEDSKAFDGGTYADASELRGALGNVDLSVSVVRGRVTTVDAEWRCFVVGREVIDASEYRRAGSPSFHRGAPPRVLDLVEAALAQWSPSDVTCIDVASSGGHFGIVEGDVPCVVEIEWQFVTTSTCRRG